MKTGLKKVISVFVAVIMLAGFIPMADFTLTAKADTWNGTYSTKSGFSQSGTTYTVSSSQGLAYFIYSIGQGTNYSGCTINLTVDCDLNNVDFSTNVWSNYDNYFKGTFNGNSHTISNFKMSCNNHRGAMFRSVDGGTFKNITFTNANISYSNNKNGYGVLVGYAKGNCTFENIKVTSGSVTGYNYVGGIVGEMQNTSSMTFTNCSNAASVTAKGANAAGIAARFDSDQYLYFTNCSNTGTVNSSGDRAGGMCAHCKGRINATNCTNTATIKAGSSDAGGVVGWVEDDESSFIGNTNSGNVSASSSVGGIMGYCGSKDGDKVFTFKNNTNTGNITSNSNAGGIAGVVYTDATQIFYNNVNRGTVSASGETAGGICGKNIGGGDWDYNYNYGAVTGSGDNAGGILGEVEDDRQYFDYCYNSATVTGKNSIGGILGFGESIDHYFTNCGNSGAVTSTSSSAGGIYGYGDEGSGTSFTQCWNVADIKAYNDAGGICGKNVNHTLITRCWNAGDIATYNHQGNGSHGGIIGYTGDAGSSTVCMTDCYNWGNVSGANYNGGLVGMVKNNAAYVIQYSYSAGSVSNGNTVKAICGTGGTISTAVYYNSGVSYGTAQGTAVTDANLQAKSITTSSNIVKNTWGVKIGSKTYYYPILTWYRNLATFNISFIDSYSGTNTTVSKLYNNTFTAPNPTRTGYTFNYWYDTANNSYQMTGGTTYTAGVNGGTQNYIITQETANVQNIHADRTSNAKWTANTYYVSYNGNGSTSGSMSNTTHTYDIAQNLTSNTYARVYTVNYNANGGSCSTRNNILSATFNGWATSSTGSVAYSNGASVKNLTSTNGATVPLYANWTLNSATLPSASKAYDSTYHYTFSGWYTAAEGGTKIGNSGASYTPTASTTLYAQYTPVAHSYTSSVQTPATCTVKGTTKYTCSCGYSYTAQDINTIAHDYTVLQADSTDHWYKCANCTATTGKTAHSGGTATCTQKAVCETCGTSYGEINPDNHDYISHDAKAPTCTAIGWNAYKTCSRCDYTSYSEITKLGHSWDNGTWNWAEDGKSATITFECANADHPETVTATVTSATKTPATCETKGTTTYTAKATFEGTEYTATKDVEDISALGHSFAQANGVANVESGKHNFKCERCDAYGIGTEKNATENCSGGTANCVDNAVCSVCEKEYGTVDANNHKTPVNKDETPATCTAVGYEAGVYCTACEKWASGHDEITATGHEWDNGTWNWAEDGKTATITFECANADHPVTVTATVTSATKTPAKCEEKGTTTYTAKATFEGEEYTDTKDVEDISALGHSWDEGTWNWSVDGKTAEITFICENDNTHTETITATVTDAVKTPATCETKGTTTYTAKASFEGDEYTDTKDVVDIPELGHSWDEGTWNWAEDGKTAEITFVCENDNAHTQTVTATVTSAEKIPAKCEEKGTTTYTAKATFEGEEYTDTKDVEDISALGHSFAQANGVANVESGKHNFKCVRCDAYGIGTEKNATENCSGGTANCVDKAVCSVCEKEYGTVDANNHKTPVNKDKVDPTCTEVGYEAGVYCNACAKWASGHEEITATGHEWDNGTWKWAEDGKSATITFECANADHPATVTATVTDAVKTPATCETKGTTTYTAKATFEGSEYTDTKDVEDISALGHNWNAGVWTWSDDGKTASVMFTCENDENHTRTVNATVTSEGEFSATCTTYGATRYTAKVEFEGNEYTDIKDIVDVPALGHDWDDGTWNWAEDGKSATITFECANADHPVTVTATVTDAVKTPAQCEAKGTTTYTAKATFEGEEYTATKDVEDIFALGHDWDEDTWNWAEDGKSATITFACANADHPETITATVTDAVKTPAKCEEKGTTTYTATASFEGDEYTDTKDVVDIPELGHDWDEGTWNWAEDGKTAEITFVCENDNAHTETVTATVTSAEKIPAKCEEKGTTTYTATASFEGDEYTDTKDVVDIPELGHDWDEGTWNWAEDGKTAEITFVCENDNAHTQTVTATVTSAEKIPAKCEEKGTTTYTAKANFKGTEYTATKDVADITALEHTEEILPAVAPKCTQTGLTQGVRCSVCKKILVAQNTVSATGHTYGTAVRENVVYDKNGRVVSYDSVRYCTVCGEQISREVTDYECPACGMKGIAEQLGADTGAGKIVTFMHKVLHAFFRLFDRVIGKGDWA